MAETGIFSPKKESCGRTTKAEHRASNPPTSVLTPPPSATVYFSLCPWKPTFVVSRINARSENYEMELTLDLNNELYPLEIGEKFSLVLATSLSLSTVVGNDTSGTQESWREKVGGERTLADDYEYVMYGKVYKYDEGQGSKV